MGLDFAVVPPYADLLWIGTLWTVVLTLASAALAFVAGIAFALIELYAPRLLALPVRLFAWVFMGTPLLLQLYLIYFGLGQIGVNLPAMVAGIIGLGLHFAVYNADVIRAGLAAVDPGQNEGARSLGLSRFQSFRSVIVPQAVRSVTPPLGNNQIALLKESALVSVLGVAELVHAAQLAISETYRPFEFYIAAAALYYILNLLLEYGLKRIERRVEASR
ncbi:MAG: amino acid ABC transporter permease [Rhodospirillales bacterium]